MATPSRSRSRRVPAARGGRGPQSVRRLGLLIEKRVRKESEWAAFQPNGPELCGRVEAALQQFLQDLFEQGSLAGAAPGEAYFVKCGMALDAQSDVDDGQLSIVVGFAPLRPAQFVILSIQQLVGQGGA
jgi:uncharacterized protein